MINTKNLRLDRIEITKKKYDSKGRIIEEQYEYYYPKDLEKSEIGFKL